MRKKLKANSVHPVENPYQDAPTGAVLQWGYFGISWPELLHQMESGMMKIGVESMVELMTEYGKSFGKQALSCQIIRDPVE